MTDSALKLFRHTLATLAYRTAKALRGAPSVFAGFRPGPTSRTPVEILAHMGDLMEASLSAAQGERKWSPTTPQVWENECQRFFDALTRFDAYLASGATVHRDVFILFQGPVLDAVTHAGQLAYLRRLAEAPMKGESYVKADIVIGRVGFEQTPPDRANEFD